MFKWPLRKAWADRSPHLVRTSAGFSVVAFTLLVVLGFSVVMPEFDVGGGHIPDACYESAGFDDAGDIGAWGACHLINSSAPPQGAQQRVSVAQDGTTVRFNFSGIVDVEAVEVSGCSSIRFHGIEPER
jgi:hypothetical protein